MSIFGLTLEELQKIESKRPLETDKIYSFIIVPLDKIHIFTGYSCMKFILLDKSNNIIGCVGKYSDIIDLNGIGGMGKTYSTNSLKKIGWRIDCLPVSKCLRIWCNKELELPDYIGDDFEIYVKEEKV